MLKFYGYSRWSTVRKAKAWLNENNIDFEEIEIVKNPPSKEELETMYNAGTYELKKFFNTSGVKYRELGLKDVVKTESDDKLLEILASDGMLIKRPIAFDGKNVLIGFKEEEWKEKLLNK